MNYLWEVVLACGESEVRRKDIHFSHARQGSPYMEVSMDCLNQEDIRTVKEIEVNTYYRFYQIFKDMFQPDLTDYPDLRNSLTNLILHQLADNDVRKGMTKEEYYKKLLAANILQGGFGVEVKTSFLFFNREQQDLLLGGWLRCCLANSSLILFTDMIYALIDNSIVYHGEESPDEILIYTSLKKTRESEGKLSLLTEVFLDIRYHVEVFYEYHFGILGIDETMQIDEIAMY